MYTVISGLFQKGLNFFLAIAFLTVLFCCTKHDGPIEIYISPRGSDLNQGTLKAPFGTFERVISEIEETLARGNADITVYLLGGVYELSKPIRISSEDFTAKEYSIRFKAYGDEKPIIRGGNDLTGWEKIEGTDIWKTKSNGITQSRELYVNDKLAILARGRELRATAWEKTDNPSIEKSNYLRSYKTFQGDLPVHEGYILHEPYAEMVGWKYPSQIEAVYLQGWTYVICPVDTIEQTEEGVYMKMHMPSFKDAQIKGGLQVEDPSYFQNAYELLDEPGEWYLNQNRQEVYYIPRKGEDMNTLKASMPFMESLVQLEGTLEKPLRNITFEGVEFTQTTYLKPGHEGFSEIQATLTKNPDIDDNMHSHFVKIGASIVLSAVEGSTFMDCKFSKFGGAGIDIGNGSRDNTIKGCHFYNIGASAIQIGGFSLRDAHPEDNRQIVFNTQISNNRIHNIGTVYKGSVGILAGFTKKTEITHNEIFDIAYSGISVGWGWGLWDVGGRNPENPEGQPESYPIFDKPTISSDHIIGWNHVYNVMSRLTDGAGIYTLSMMENTRIIGNHIHDNPKNLDYYEQSEFMTAKYTQGWPGGIYLDEGSGGVEVTGNLVYNVIQPFFYNNLMYKGYPWYEREDTNKVHNNYFGDMPFNSDELRYLEEKNALGIDSEEIELSTVDSIIKKAGRQNKNIPKP